MSWKCAICKKEHQELPTCFGAEAPWRILVPEKEFEKRVILTPDLCVIDGKTFLVRGHIEIPIVEANFSLAFSVWASLSERSFDHMSERWDCADRGSDEPYFGWLSTSLPIYPDTVHLKLSVQSQDKGFVPLLTLEPTEHPLACDQSRGISLERYHEIALKLLNPNP